MQNSEQEINPKVILLDVYETLLDMSEVERRVNNLLNSKRGYSLWMELFMQYCFVDNCTIQFNDFSSIARATMQMAGQSLGRKVEEDDINEVLEQLKHLPVHKGVQDGLSQLHDKGFRIAALTNIQESIVKDRMERTGLISYFEKVLSAEHVKRYKPCIEVYQWAAQQMQEDIQNTLLVSAHGWDIAGAANAKMKTAYMKQSKQMLYPLAPDPNLICSSLEDLAFQLKTITDATNVEKL